MPETEEALRSAKRDQWIGDAGQSPEVLETPEAPRVPDVRCRGEQEDMARTPRHFVGGLMSNRIAAGVVRFVNDNDVPGDRRNGVEYVGLLEVVGRDDPDACAGPGIVSATHRPCQGLESVAVGDCERKPKPLMKFLAPLVSQGPRHDHHSPESRSTSFQLDEHNSRLNGFSQPDLVGDEHAPNSACYRQSRFQLVGEDIHLDVQDSGKAASGLRACDMASEPRCGLTDVNFSQLRRGLRDRGAVER
jgi:hypothetical protein